MGEFFVQLPGQCVINLLCHYDRFLARYTNPQVKRQSVSVAVLCNSKWAKEKPQQYHEQIDHRA